MRCFRDDHYTGQAQGRAGEAGAGGRCVEQPLTPAESDDLGLGLGVGDRSAAPGTGGSPCAGVGTWVQKVLGLREEWQQELERWPLEQGGPGPGAEGGGCEVGP